MRVPDIAVTDGQCQIGLRSVAGAGNYCSLDDGELVGAAGLAPAPGTAPGAPEPYPNPATGLLYLRPAPGLPLAGPVGLHSLTGQLLRVLAAGPTALSGGQPLPSFQLPAELPAELPVGIYMLRVGGAPSW